MRGFEREEGRRNGSFSVAEILKPMGFRKFCGYKILFDYLSRAQMKFEVPLRCLKFYLIKRL